MHGFLETIRTLGLPCESIAALVSRSLDEELDPGQSLGVRLHLFYCRACRRFRAQILRLRLALRQAPEHLASHLDGASLPDNERARLKRIINRESR